jgi:hypothetical protein
MQLFTLAILGCVMVCDFLVQSLALPPILRFLPECISCIVILYVLIAGTRDRFQFVAPKYWFVFIMLAVVVACGIINNNPGAGPMISGARFYFRATPLFFLAAVLPMSDENLMRQLKLLLYFGFLQLPVAMYQRWIILDQDRFSGDDVRGTLIESGILSMFLICAALVLVGLVLKRRIGNVWFLVLFLILLFPTTINETKVTVIFLPIGLFVTVMVGAQPGKRLRYAALGMTALMVFGAIFIPIYDLMEEKNPYKVSIVDFFTNEKELNKYLVSNTKSSGAGVGSSKHAHRAEAMVVPVKYLAKDPVRFAFGLGLGNVSPSNIGKNFEGNYYGLFQNLLELSFTYFVLEFGVLGVVLIGALFWMVFWDSVKVARSDDSLTAGIASGFAGVVCVFLISTIYNNFHLFTSVTFLYWYFAGVICARAMALRRGAVRVPQSALQTQLTTARFT